MPADLPPKSSAGDQVGMCQPRVFLRSASATCDASHRAARSGPIGNRGGGPSCKPVAPVHSAGIRLLPKVIAVGGQ
jgi:hypothetical protein